MAVGLTLLLPEGARPLPTLWSIATLVALVVVHARVEEPPVVMLAGVAVKLATSGGPCGDGVPPPVGVQPEGHACTEALPLLTVIRQVGVEKFDTWTLNFPLLLACPLTTPSTEIDVFGTAPFPFAVSVPSTNVALVTLKPSAGQLRSGVCTEVLPLLTVIQQAGAEKFSTVT